MSPSLYLDVLVAVLLAATIIYGSLLNRKLGALRSNKAELDVLIQSFNDACMRAEAGVKTLRTATDEATRLQQYLARGQMLRDDLAFLIERGTVIADRLEGNVRSARAEARAESPARPLTAEPSSGRSSRATASAAAPAAEPVAPSKPILAMTEIKPMADAAEEPAPRAGRERAALRGGEAGPRSKAERELLEALRAKR
jgi:hypothetical protein